MYPGTQNAELACSSVDWSAWLQRQEPRVRILAVPPGRERRAGQDQLVFVGLFVGSAAYEVVGKPHGFQRKEGETIS